MSITEIIGAAMLAMPFVALFAMAVRLEGAKVAVSIAVFVAALVAWLVVGIELLKGAS